MREDMDRVICERPRYASPERAKGRMSGACQDLEDLPKQEGVRRPHALRGNEKSFGDYLSPLRRYLDRQVGRPWRKVYSEITARLRVDSTVQQHLRDHLKDFVMVAPRLLGHRRTAFDRDGLWWQEFYVDPRTGLLCRTDRHPAAKAERKARRKAAGGSPGHRPV